MTERLLKCYGEYCQKHDIKHPKSELIKHSGKNYCKTCYDKLIKDKEDRGKLYSYVAEIYDISYPTPLMMKHIKEMKETYGWSYKRIYALINYVVTYKKILDPKYGLRYYANDYQEMVNYYAEKKKRKENNKGKKNKSKTIVVNSENFKVNKYKNEKLYDMNEENE
jgi:hypothetical protein